MRKVCAVFVLLADDFDDAFGLASLPFALFLAIRAFQASEEDNVLVVALTKLPDMTTTTTTTFFPTYFFACFFFACCCALPLLVVVVPTFFNPLKKSNPLLLNFAACPVAALFGAIPVQAGCVYWSCDRKYRSWWCFTVDHN
jgi:hypothetical protein